MSKELKKLYKTALTSMNYFFLQIVFKDGMYTKSDKSDNGVSINNHLYQVVKCELQVFLDALVKEKDLSEEIKRLFKEELIEGEYIKDKTLNEIENELTIGINSIFEYNYSELLDFYMNLIEDIKNKLE